MKKKLAVINTVLILLLFIAIVLSFIMYNKQKQKSYYNEARIMLKDDINLLQDNKLDSVTHSYYIVDLWGKVVFSTVDDVHKDDILSLDEVFQTDNYFIMNNKDKIRLVFTLKSGNNLDRIAVFVVDKYDIINQTSFSMYIYFMIPLFCWMIIFAIALAYNNFYINIRMIKPINEITDSSNAIVSGNYDKSIVQSSTKNILNSEMANLSYNFERMRDELKAKSIRENELKTAHKELLSCMSHDLRTPITTIKAHAEALRDGVADSEQKEQKYINTIIRKTDVVSRMISDLLDHSNAECNQLSINKTEIYFYSYLKNICKELVVYCNKYDVKFISHLDIPQVMVIADEARITQVIYNLVENAVKYNSNQDKEIILSSFIDKNSDRIYISVEDNGNGVSLSDISFVFNKFYRAEMSRSMQIPGAGLGLSICKYIIEAHGGEITVDNSDDKGAIFTFFIPYK